MPPRFSHIKKNISITCTFDFSNTIFICQFMFFIIFKSRCTKTIYLQKCINSCLFYWTTIFIHDFDFEVYLTSP